MAWGASWILRWGYQQAISESLAGGKDGWRRAQAGKGAAWGEADPDLFFVAVSARYAQRLDVRDAGKLLPGSGARVGILFQRSRDQDCAKRILIPEALPFAKAPGVRAPLLPSKVRFGSGRVGSAVPAEVGREQGRVSPPGGYRPGAGWKAVSRARLDRPESAAGGGNL